MKHALPFEIERQPDLMTCGPTSLHAVYRFYGRVEALADVIARTPTLERGGTLAVMLALDALDHGFYATIHTFNLRIFDPTWFASPDVDIPAKLRAQRGAKGDDPRFCEAIDAYLEFFERGGRLAWGDLTPGLLRSYLAGGHPILTGLSSTYLYQEARECSGTGEPDDVKGIPAGHFVVLTGIDRDTGMAQIADPLEDNVVSGTHHYEVELERVVCSILLGVLTYDSNFLVLSPKSPPEP